MNFVVLLITGSTSLPTLMRIMRSGIAQYIANDVLIVSFFLHLFDTEMMDKDLLAKV